MLALVILSVGIAIVIGGILRLRLPAFIALVLAGLSVAMLTPSRLIERTVILQESIPATDYSFSANGQSITFPDARDNPGNALLLRNNGRDSDWTKIGTLSSVDADPNRLDAKLTTDELPSVEDLYVISMTDYAHAKKLGASAFLSRLTTTLGEYCGKFAILIVAASIIGRCLLDSGAADRIVGSTLKVLGERMAPAAFVTSGFVLSIPVFFDTVFYLMIPLGKALRIRTGGNYLLYVLAIVAGGTMAHSLVPPTPGPLFIAEEFEVPLDSMIVGGTIVGLFSASVGMIYAFWINRRCVLPLRDLDETSVPASSSDDTAPSLMVSLIPIVLPVLLIFAGAMVNRPVADGGYTLGGIGIPDSLAGMIKTLSEKNLALLISAGFAVLIYLRVKRPGKVEFSEGLQKAVSSAGAIILVTAAGGAFGRMMQQTCVAELLQDLPGSSPITLVVAAFFVTTAVRTAQGSATVAMVTSAGIFGGIVAGGAAGVDPLYVALAVGCGSKPFSWMNDSGFLVITRMSGMTEEEGLKYVTPMTAIAAFAGLGAVIVGMTLFP